MKRTIAAIIPLYNGAAFIEAAIRSVLGQDRAADELIVVDDGSTDDGAEIVRRLAREFPVIKLVTKANGGQGSARNSGVASSGADLVAFLDQDDEWYPHHLRILEQPFSEPASIPLGWVYSNLDTIDASGRMIDNSVLDTFKSNAHPKQSIFSCLGQDMFVLPGASLISHSAFDKVGGFDEQFVGYEDDDLFLRLFAAGFRNVYINQALTKWRLHAASTSFSEKMAISRVRYFSKLTANFPDEIETMRFYARDYIAPRFTKTAMVDLVTGIAWNDQVRIRRSYQQVVRFSKPLAPAKGRLLRGIAYLLTLQPVQMIYRAMPRRIIQRAKGLLSS
jgi:glycosyltransferase involved in cell wall biosynthesis